MNCCKSVSCLSIIQVEARKVFMNFSPFGFGSPSVIDCSGPATGLPAPFDNAENWTSLDLEVPDVAMREGIGNLARAALLSALTAASAAVDDSGDAWVKAVAQVLGYSATAADPKKTFVLG